MRAKDYIPRRIRPAVLLYHRVVERGDPRDPHAVTADRFEAQIRHLAARRRAPGGAPAALVTFDDGYLDTYAIALPILRRHGLAAVVFVVTGAVGRTSGAWGPPAPAPMMSWAHLDELARMGFSVQSHTRTHADLTRCGDADALAELAGSRAELEDRLGRPVDAIAYPFGRLDARVVALAAQAGYRRGWAAGFAPPGPLSQERFQITALDGPRAFALKASGWGAWIRRVRHGARGGLPSPGPLAADGGTA